MTEKNFTPFELHALAPEGIGVIVKATTQLTAVEKVLYPGESLTVTREIYELNLNRDGYAWLDADTETQIKIYGHARFGVGPVPAHVIEAVKATRLAQAVKERDNLLKTNPHLQRKTGAALRIDTLNAEIKQG